MKKKKFQLEVPGGADKVLLHTCCAPCSSAIIECLMQHGITPVIYYCNPNIYPLEEYNIRKDECTRYAQSLGLEIVDADYNHEDWLCHIKGMEQEPEREDDASVASRCVCWTQPVMPTNMGLRLSPRPLHPVVGRVWSKSTKQDIMPLHTIPMSFGGSRIGAKVA